MADRTVYVDGTTSGTPGTTGAHYASLQAMVTGETGAAADLVAGSAILHVECSVFAGNAADTTACVIQGFTTNATYYVHIYTAAASRHAGVWSTSKYRLEVNNASALIISDEYVRVDGLQIGKSAMASNDRGAVEIYSVGTAVIHLSNLITRHAPEAFRQMGLWIPDADVTCYVWNWIDYGHPDVQSNYNASLIVEAAATVHVYSSTLIGGYYGMFLDATGGTINAKNVYAAATSTSGTAILVGLGTINQTTCASSDTTAVGTGLDNIAVNATNFTNVTPGSENFHLPTGSALKDVGTTTSGEAFPLNFTTDIDGETRSGTWDIGADEFAGAGLPALTVQLAEPAIGGSVF